VSSLVSLIAAMSLLASFGSAASADMKAACEPLGPWTPVKMPETNVYMPCSESALSDFKNANEERKKADGVVRCDRDKSRFIVMYLVNTPPGFFEHFAGTSTDKFEVQGHQFVRSQGQKGDKVHNEQLMKLDDQRAILMLAQGAIENKDEYAKTASCFFSAFEVLK